MREKKRRLFIGDIHGCIRELEDLLQSFRFDQDRDSLFTVGDIMGRGPFVPEALALLKSLNARSVMGNHEHAAITYSRIVKELRTCPQERFLDALGPERDRWIREVCTWPLYLEFEDIILVHAGLEPGKKSLSEMDAEILINIRNWDGSGRNLDNEANPQWYTLVDPGKTVIFGHWAKNGLVDLPGLKGIDTGCVYGNSLTGYCPEEDRFYSVPSRRVYSDIKRDTQ